MAAWKFGSAAGGFWNCGAPKVERFGLPVMELRFAPRNGQPGAILKLEFIGRG
jgi:hypothetical protein